MPLQLQVGDDSAFELGCLKMERGEFLPAVRLFSKILDEYPKTDLDPVLVEIRLAGSLARVGSAVEALGMVDALYEKFPAYRRILTLVKADIEEVRRNQGGSDGGSDGGSTGGGGGSSGAGGGPGGAD